MERFFSNGFKPFTYADGGKPNAAEASRKTPNLSRAVKSHLKTQANQRSITCRAPQPGAWSGRDGEEGGGFTKSGHFLISNRMIVCVGGCESWCGKKMKEKCLCANVNEPCHKRPTVEMALCVHVTKGSGTESQTRYQHTV